MTKKMGKICVPKERILHNMPVFVLDITIFIIKMSLAFWVMKSFINIVTSMYHSEILVCEIMAKFVSRKTK